MTRFADFGEKKTLDKLVNMATKKVYHKIKKLKILLLPRWEKLPKFQGNGLLRFRVLSHLLGQEVENTPPGAYRVNFGHLTGYTAKTVGRGRGNVTKLK